jgi:predicted nucleic acid-binding protein
MVLVDSNVLTDIFTEDAAWFAWSAEQLVKARERTMLAVNPIIFAEISPNFDSLKEIEEALPESDYLRLELPYAASFLTGQAYVRYRRQGGRRALPLPDFYIGAHAQVEELELLTRDAQRYRTYFPEVRLIAPD